MTVTGKTTRLEGNTVTITADSEATARQIAAAVEDQRIQIEGRAPQQIERGLGKALDSLFAIDTAAERRIADIVSWAFLVIASFFAFRAGSNLFGVSELKPLFGAFGVGVVIATKFSAARWAREKNEGDDPAARMFRNVTVAGIVVSGLMGFSLQAANTVNRQTGAATQKSQLEANAGILRRLHAEADEMDRPSDPADAIALELKSALAKSAKNYDGENAKFNIAEAIDYGEENFCRGSAYYKNKYCPDILELEAALQSRTAYEGKLSEIHALEAATTELRGKTSELSSAEAVGSVLFAGEGRSGLIKGMLTGMILILFIDLFMVGAAYVAHRYPAKGVS